MKNDLVVAYLQHGSSSIILSQKINWNEKILKWVWEKLKANNRSTENLKKKTCHLNELAPETAIRSCHTGQHIPWFDTCQLTIIWMSIIRLNTGYRPPILARKFDILHWLPRGADGWLERHTVKWLLKFLRWTDNQNFLRCGAPLARVWHKRAKKLPLARNWDWIQ